MPAQCVMVRASGAGARGPKPEPTRPNNGGPNGARAEVRLPIESEVLCSLAACSRVAVLGALVAGLERGSGGSVTCAVNCQ